MGRNNRDIEILSEEEKQEFLNDVFFCFCPNCGKEIVQPRRGRRKVFCSDKCRWEWKTHHCDYSRWKTARLVTCPVCGRQFIAVREKRHKRKYCSRGCANKARAMKKAAGKKEEKNG